MTGVTTCLPAVRQGSSAAFSECFYSHEKKADVEQTRDTELGIDRGAFSNLWMEPMAIGELPLLQHSFLQNVEVQCIESCALVIQKLDVLLLIVHFVHSLSIYLSNDYLADKWGFFG